MMSAACAAADAGEGRAGEGRAGERLAGQFFPPGLLLVGQFSKNLPQKIVSFLLVTLPVLVGRAFRRKLVTVASDATLLKFLNPGLLSRRESERPHHVSLPEGHRAARLEVNLFEATGLLVR